MKLKVNHFNKTTFEELFSDLKHIDFSLFVDAIPESQDDLSSINIISFQEPNEYFGIHDWVIQNKDLFSFILTWDDKVLNNCDNATFLPFGLSWFTPDQYSIDKIKTFEIAHLRGNLLKTYGHSLRHELLDRKNEITIPTKFFDVYGDRNNLENARKGKEEVFGNPMFGVAIENTQHNGYFTEKIIDCFLQKTIPVYWGCSNINEFFNIDGIITFTSVDDLIRKANSLNEKYYYDCLEAINENYKLAIQYIDYPKNIHDKVLEIFQFNNLI
jgi:hypothetical protein